MAGQRFAHRETDCAECHRYIAQDDPIWWSEGSVYCTNCAVKRGIDCPECHGGKSPAFAVCFECNKKPKKPQKADLI